MIRGMFIGATTATAIAVVIWLLLGLDSDVGALAWGFIAGYIGCRVGALWGEQTWGS